MDWSNETYIRLYIRDTPEWLCWAWQARALLPLFMRKLDRSGVFQTKLGAKGVAVSVGLPVEVVEVGMAELLADGCVKSHLHGFVMENFMHAQEAKKTDKARQRESRERRKTGNESDNSVTFRDEMSRAVTDGHTESHGVTSGHSLLCFALPCLAVEEEKSPGEPAPPAKVKRTVQATEVPADWEPEGAIGLSHHERQQLERFRNHHRAKGNRFKRIDQAWRNWISSPLAAPDGRPGIVDRPVRKLEAL